MHNSLTKDSRFQKRGNKMYVIYISEVADRIDIQFKKEEIGMLKN